MFNAILIMLLLPPRPQRYSSLQLSALWARRHIIDEAKNEAKMRQEQYRLVFQQWKPGSNNNRSKLYHLLQLEGIAHAKGSHTLKDIKITADTTPSPSVSALLSAFILILQQKFQASTEVRSFIVYSEYLPAIPRHCLPFL